MVKASPQVRGWPPVVLRGSEHDDRLGRPALIAPALLPHLQEGHAEVHHDQYNEGRSDPHPPPEERRDHALPRRTRAASIRANVRSRPRTSSDSNRGGPTVRPVIATRIGACAFPSAKS